MPAQFEDIIKEIKLVLTQQFDEKKIIVPKTKETQVNWTQVTHKLQEIKQTYQLQATINNSNNAQDVASFGKEIIIQLEKKKESLSLTIQKTRSTWGYFWSSYLQKIVTKNVAQISNIDNTIKKIEGMIPSDESLELDKKLKETPAPAPTMPEEIRKELISQINTYLSNATIMTSSYKIKAMQSMKKYLTGEISLDDARDEVNRCKGTFGSYSFAILNNSRVNNMFNCIMKIVNELSINLKSKLTPPNTPTNAEKQLTFKDRLIKIIYPYIPNDQEEHKEAKAPSK